MGPSLTFIVLLRFSKTKGHTNLKDNVKIKAWVENGNFLLLGRFSTHEGDFRIDEEIDFVKKLSIKIACMTP